MNTERSDFDRALRTWFEDGPTVLSDRVVDGIASRIARQPQRRAWRLQGRPFVNTYLKLAAGLAAALAVAVVGWNVLPRDGGSGSPSPTPLMSPTPSVSPATSATPRAAGMVVQGKSVSWTALRPEGWTSLGWYLTAGQGTAGPTGISVTATGAVNVPSDPCDGVGQESDGQSVDDVVAALQARDDLVVSDPTATTLGGYSGTRIDVEAPADLSACDGAYIIFAEPDGSGLPAQGPSNVLRIWIIDVEGRPMIFLIQSYAGTPPEDLTEAQQIVDSIVITP